MLIRRFSRANTAEALFWENTRWNSALARTKAKPKRKGIGNFMKPDEVIKKLKQMGISMDRSTLTRYVKWELITKPEYRSGGRGTAPIVDYPENAVAEAAAAELMRRGGKGKKSKWKKEHVAAARELSAILDTTGVLLDKDRGVDEILDDLYKYRDVRTPGGRKVDELIDILSESKPGVDKEQWKATATIAFIRGWVWRGLVEVYSHVLQLVKELEKTGNIGNFR